MTTHSIQDKASRGREHPPRPSKALKDAKVLKPRPQHTLERDALVGGQSIELLKALHILTREGQLNQDSRRKLKQVNHLVQLLEGPLRELARVQKSGAQRPLTLVDHGAGKSYLGFVLYDRFGADPSPERLSEALGPANEGSGAMALKVIAVESRAELVARSAQLAQDFGFTGMAFLNARSEDAGALQEMPQTVDVVTALHACDTLSDDAIEFALSKSAQLMFLVPCCQAETASVLKANRALLLNKTPLAELWRHPLHTRELGSQLTNVMRCLYLEALGYTVTVTELVGWEHSMKNELIVAKFTGNRKKQAAQRLKDLLAQFGVEGLLSKRFARIESGGEGW
jgi:hypothetical protein